MTVHHVEGAGRLRSQRRGRRGAGRGAAGPGGARAAGPGAVVPRGRDGLGAAGPAMLARLSAGLDAGGRIVTWRQDVWSNGFIGRPGHRRRAAAARPGPPGRRPPDAAGARTGPAGAMGCHPQRGARLRHPRPRRSPGTGCWTMPIRTSSLRSLGAFLNVFAIESFMDELAAAAGADPVEFRLAHLTDPRARRVHRAGGRAWPGWAARARRRRHRVRAWATPGTRARPGTARRSPRWRRTPTSGCAGCGWPWTWAGSSTRTGCSTRSRAARCRARAGRCASGSASTGTRITSVSWDSYPILRFTEVPEVAVRVLAAPGEAGDRRGRGGPGPGGRRHRQRGGRRGRRPGPRPAAHPRAGHPRDRGQLTARVVRAKDVFRHLLESRHVPRGRSGLHDGPTLAAGRAR